MVIKPQAIQECPIYWTNYCQFTLVPLTIFYPIVWAWDPNNDNSGFVNELLCEPTVTDLQYDLAIIDSSNSHNNWGRTWKNDSCISAFPSSFYLCFRDARVCRAGMLHRPSVWPVFDLSPAIRLYQNSKSGCASSTRTETPCNWMDCSTTLPWKAIKLSREYQMNCPPSRVMEKKTFCLGQWLT